LFNRETAWEKKGARWLGLESWKGNVEMPGRVDGSYQTGILKVSAKKVFRSGSQENGKKKPSIGQGSF